MPSRDFMERVLNTGRNEEIEEEDVALDQVEEETPANDESPETAEEDTPPDSEVSEEPEAEEDGEPEEEEADQPEEEDGAEATAAHEDDFYLGRYKNREEAEKGWLEKEGMISRQGEELAQLRQQQAEMQGYLTALQQQQSQSAPGEFEAWAEQQFESGNAWGGANEALDAALSTGDPAYVDSYVEQWKEHDPFEAARFRTMVDNQIAEAQREAQRVSQPPPPQQILNAVWVEMAGEDPDLANPEIAKEVGAILRDNVALRGAATSGYPDAIRDAISVARDRYKVQGARTQGGTPRKVRSSDAERTAQAKLDATVTTGDSSPERGNGSTPEVAPELQEMVQRITAGEGGFPRLRE